MSTYTKQLYSPLAVQPQTIAVPHVPVQQVTSWTTPQKTTLCVEDRSQLRMMSLLPSVTDATDAICAQMPLRCYSSLQQKQDRNKNNRTSPHYPSQAVQVTSRYFSRLHLAPQVIQTRFQGSRLSLLPWSYTFKEIRAGKQQREAAAGKTEGACSANKAKVTVFKQKGGGGEGSFLSVSSQSKAG